jgi:hypothetical protein
MLFPEASYERFRKYLELTVRKHALDLNRTSLDAADIGVHSIRKGAATYCCSGTTMAPSIAAVCNCRAGWSMGQVKDIYIRYETASDHYVDRIVAGLDVLSEAIAVSPPHFCANVPAEAILGHIQLVFPSIVSIEWRLLAEMFVASLYISRPDEHLPLLIPCRVSVSHSCD